MDKNSMGKTKKLVFMALLTAIALTIFVIENQIPAPVPIPGVKLGLSNIITLVAMLLLGRKEAGAILLVRVLMGAMFAGSPSTLLFSAAGGLLAYLVMCGTVGLFSESQLVKTPGILAYAPILAVSGVITGVFTGIAAMFLIRALRKLRI